MSAEKLKLEVLLAAIDKASGPLKSISNASTVAGKALKAARDQLKLINAQQENITAFKKAEKDAAIAENTFKATQARIRQLKEEIAKVPEPTKAMVRALADATKQAEQLKTRHAELMNRQQGLFSQMKAGGIDVNNLAHHSRDLATQQIAAAQAVSKLSDAYATQRNRLSKLNAARDQYNKSMALKDKLAGYGGKALVAGAAINATAAIPVIAYAKAEDSATQLKVALMQSGGKISEQFKDINDLAERLGNRLPGTTSDFQDMMTMLIRQGMPAKAILGGLGEATAYLAVQLKMAPTAAAEFASRLQDATRTTDKDMMSLMDTIQKTFYLGVDQNNMLQGFAKLSPALSIIRKEGAGAAQALAPLLVMTDQAGMAGEAAGNAYRKIFQMAMDAKKVAKGNAALHGTGIALDFTDGKGEFGGLEKMYAQLEKLKGVSTQNRLAALKKIFGDDAETLQALTIMIEKGIGGYRDVQAKMAAQADIQARVNLQLKTLKNLWDAATGTFTNALVAFGESIAPELHAAAEWMGKLAERTQAWAKANPELAAGLMHVVKWTGVAVIGIGGLLTAAAGVLAPIAMLKLTLAAAGIQGITFAGVAGTLSGAIKMVGGAIGWVGRLLMTNPILLAVALIAGAVYLIYQNWEPIKAFFGGIFDAIRTKLDALGTMFKAGDWIGIGKAIIDGIEVGLDVATFGLYSKVKSIGAGIVETAKKVLDIRSPSRVFAELGGFTMEGFERGIIGGKDGPLAALAQASKQFAAAGAGLLIGGGAMAMPPLDTRPALAPAAMAAGGAPMIVQITINAAPGMDEQTLAQKVADEFRRIEAQRAASRRSRLTDAE